MIDTHCHLIDPQFKKDLDSVIRRAYSSGVSKIVNAGYDVKTSTDAVTMAHAHNELLPAIGIHPNEAASEALNEMTAIEEIAAREKIYAIGETGLDYYRDRSPKSAQQELFRRHIALARNRKLPLLIHTRNSIDDAVRILREEKYGNGVFHCYSGTYEQARKILDMGFYCGFAGVLTFSKQMRDVFRKLPQERIVLETDAPFLSPAGHRGRRNEPSYIVEILHFAADTLELSPEALETLLDANAAKLFSL